MAEVSFRKINIKKKKEKKKKREEQHKTERETISIHDAQARRHPTTTNHESQAREEER